MKMKAFILKSRPLVSHSFTRPPAPPFVGRPAAWTSGRPRLPPTQPHHLLPREDKMRKRAPQLNPVNWCAEMTYRTHPPPLEAWLHCVHRRKNTCSLLSWQKTLRAQNIFISFTFLNSTSDPRWTQQHCMWWMNLKEKLLSQDEQEATSSAGVNFQHNSYFLLNI